MLGGNKALAYLREKKKSIVLMATKLKILVSQLIKKNSNVAY